MCLAGLLAAMALGYGVTSFAYTDEEIKKEWNYKEHVPENMRELVSEKQYQTISLKLGKLADPITGGNLAPMNTVMKVAASPCGASLNYLAIKYMNDPATRQALVRVNKGLQPPPVGYDYANPWSGNDNASGLVRQMLNVFCKWCTFLPEISGDQDNGLHYIQYFSWFYYRNPAGMEFVQSRDRAGKSVLPVTGLTFTRSFSRERGSFMDSKASRDKISQWLKDPRIEIEDYQKTKTDEYGTWNKFFAREITIDEKTKTIPSRPATMPLSEYPKRDYIVVSPTDCIMNPLVQMLEKEGAIFRKYIDNPLQQDMVLDVKNIPISLMALLGSASEKLKKEFIGGTGLSCVLMPNTYHYFHSPVNGEIVHAEVVSREKIEEDAREVHIGTYGYEDFTNWVPLSGNVGRPGTDFSQFQLFQRGVVIIKVTYKDVDGKTDLTGYVASIPVGLDTIGSVVLDDDIKEGKKVKRGYTRLGNFYYGGSLNILLFSKGLTTGAVQTRLGNQIGLFNIGKTPSPPKSEGWTGK